MPLSLPVKDPHPAAAKPRRWLAALSVVGALVVALPLVQVLRFQVDELNAVRLERAGLDPMARAVDAQLQLSLHRDLAGGVLRGQTALEPRRVQQQRSVDVAVAALAADLAGGFWPRARKESDALGSDWAALTAEIVARRVTPAQSDLSHRLLVEHCLQITDDLAAAGVRHSGLRADATAKVLRQMQALPREMWRGAQAVHTSPQAVDEASAAFAVQMQRFKSLQASAAKALGERGRTLEIRRDLLLATLGLLATLMLLGVGVLLRSLRAARPAMEAAPPSPPHATLRHRDPARADPTTVAALRRMRDAKPVRDATESPTTLPPL